MFTLISPPEQRISAAMLSPKQRKAFDGLVKALDRGDFAVLRDLGSDGKTTVLRALQHELGGSFVGMREFVDQLQVRDPFQVEEAFLSLIDTEMAVHDLLLIDDLHLIRTVTKGYNWVRQGLLNAVLTSILARLREGGKRAVFATDEMPRPLARRAHATFIDDFAAEDFRAICSAYLSERMLRKVDFAEVHRHAPNLNAHQLRNAAVWFSHETDCDTQSFCAHLNVENLSSNVDVKEVEAVTWNDLKGVEDVIRELEAKIALPFENHALTLEWNLKPKRGVLLAGPPGTGKTTIGRALAHRLRGKFFLVDGTMIAGSGDFYTEIDRVFEAAEANAPSVVFIDDADVIFGGDKESGLYRYLLTKLDGLESKGAGRICVMMTAMEPADLPAAILRSGRVELWLETRLPDGAAREQIFREALERMPSILAGADVRVLAQGTRGFTGADLKAVIEDAKLSCAYDHVKSSDIRPADAYFLSAIAALRKNRAKYRKRKPVHVSDPPVFGFGANGAVRN